MSNAWLEFLSSSIGALIGAVAGGVAAYFVTRSQTKRVLANERKLAGEAAEELRRIRRHEVSIEAAADLIEVIAGYTILERLLMANRRNDEMHRTIEDATRELRRVGNARSHLIDATVRGRWEVLLELVTSHSRIHHPASAGDDCSWRDHHQRRRAMHDVLSYAAYVRRNLVAIIDESPLPKDADPPILLRPEMSVWQPPDEPYYVDGDASSDSS